MKISSEKIDEWIMEVQVRPDSAALIIQYLGNRLHDLSGRNEALLAENIDLQTGRRVEAYEQRIAHLEYQLDLLKRQFSGDQGALDLIAEHDLSGGPSGQNHRDALVYDAHGRVIRTRLALSDIAAGHVLEILQPADLDAAETPRLCVVPGSEELIFVFTSGRIASKPVASIPLREGQSPGSWKTAPIPEEPHPGEALAIIAPISRLALSDSIIQISRKGFVKRIRSNMAQSILANRYVGAGVNQASDRTFSLNLAEREGRLVLISQEGYLLCLDLKQLSFSIEEAIRLGVTDHLAAAFILPQGQSVLAMTQVGKGLHIAPEALEMGSIRTRGQSFLSAQRRAKGVRVVGGAAVEQTGWVGALHLDGRLTIHNLENLLEAGTIGTGSELLDIAVFAMPQATK
jgi:DNA gyrase/topoisomerase IV subunit A